MRTFNFMNYLSDQSSPMTDTSVRNKIDERTQRFYSMSVKILFQYLFNFFSLEKSLNRRGIWTKNPRNFFLIFGSCNNQFIWFLDTSSLPLPVCAQNTQHNQYQTVVHNQNYILYNRPCVDNVYYSNIV